MDTFLFWYFALYRLDHPYPQNPLPSKILFYKLLHIGVLFLCIHIFPDAHHIPPCLVTCLHEFKELFPVTGNYDGIPRNYHMDMPCLDF